MATLPVALAICILLATHLPFSITSDDRQCSQSQNCHVASSCPWFQQKIKERAAFDKGSEQYNHILDLLKNSICNKEEKKVCCPVEICSLPDLGEQEERCSVPDLAEQEEASLECFVEEVCDPVEGLVCKTTCSLITTAFSISSHKSNKKIPNCRCGSVYSIKRGKCVRNRFSKAKCPRG